MVAGYLYSQDRLLVGKEDGDIEISMNLFVFGFKNYTHVRDEQRTRLTWPTV